MRVITGKYRGKVLLSPDKKSRTRPTTDRIKETMFNILFSKGVCDGICVLDLFAGTGALGIEALSRGAESCIFIDIETDSCKLIRQNLAAVGAKGEVYHAAYKTALAKLSGKTFDLILIDPPYHQEKEQEILELIAQYELLAAKGVIVVEHSRDNKITSAYFTGDTRDCGNTMLTFLEKNDHNSIKFIR